MRSLLLLDTGGTIGTSRNAAGALGHAAIPMSTRLLLAEARVRDIRIDTIEPRDIFGGEASGRDSSRIGPADWSRMATAIAGRLAGHDGVILLHGTDTLAYTASALSFALGALAVPVILTGAQRSAADADSDAAGNIRFALDAALGRFGDFAGEVVIAFDGRLMRGNRATKVSIDQSRGFATPAFPEHEPGGSDDSCPSLAAWRASRPIERAAPSHRFNSNIWIIDTWPGLCHDRLENLFDAVRPEGIIIRLFGVGTAPPETNVAELAADLAQRDIPMLAISSVPGGPLDWRRYESTAALLEAPLLNGLDMTIEAAATKLMWVLASTREPAQRRELLVTNLAGEMSSVGPSGLGWPSRGRSPAHAQAEQ